MTEPKIMKHVITILLFIPIITFGQTLESANKLYKNKSYKKAYQEYVTIIQNDSNAYDAYLGLANCYFEFKDYDAAINTCSKAIQLEPNKWEAYDLRGSIYFIMKNYEKAIVDLDKLIELNVEDKLALAYFTRGASKLELKNKDGGCADLKKAKELGWNTSIPGLNKYCGVTDLE